MQIVTSSEIIVPFLLSAEPITLRLDPTVSTDDTLPRMMKLSCPSFCSESQSSISLSSLVIVMLMSSNDQVMFQRPVVMLYPRSCSILILTSSHCAMFCLFACTLKSDSLDAHVGSSVQVSNSQSRMQPWLHSQQNGQPSIALKHPLQLGGHTSHVFIMR